MDLSRIFLFSTCTPTDIQRISNFVTEHRLKSGEILFSEGMDATCFYAVESGSVKIFKVSLEGKEQIIHIVGEGDIMAEAAIFGLDRYPAHCVAVEPSVVIRIPKHEFIDFLMKNPAVSLTFLKAYSQKLRQLVSLVEDLSLNDIRKRFANYLLQHMREDAGVWVVDLGLSKKEIAAYLGTTPETLSRTILIYKNEGLLADEMGRFVVLDADRLRRLNLGT